MGFLDLNFKKVIAAVDTAPYDANKDFVEISHFCLLVFSSAWIRHDKLQGKGWVSLQPLLSIRGIVAKLNIHNNSLSKFKHVAWS